MPTPLALCLEDLNPAPGAPRFLSCVALSGGEPGLGLDAQGQVRWLQDGRLAFELWVSLDQQLILWRREGAPELQVRREERGYPVPGEKPVVLLDGDHLDLPGRRLRLHLHGPAGRIQPPEPFEPRREGALRVATAAALALGTALSAAPQPSPRPLEVRQEPPKVAPPPSLAEPPRVLEQAQPVYPDLKPEEASFRKQAQRVLLLVRVDARGAFVSATLNDPFEGPKAFVESAQDASARSRYRAARDDRGKPCGGDIEVVFDFPAQEN